MKRILKILIPILLIILVSCSKKVHLDIEQEESVPPYSIEVNDPLI